MIYPKKKDQVLWNQNICSNNKNKYSMTRHFYNYKSSTLHRHKETLWRAVTFFRSWLKRRNDKEIILLYFKQFFQLLEKTTKKLSNEKKKCKICCWRDFDEIHFHYLAKIMVQKLKTFNKYPKFYHWGLNQNPINIFFHRKIRLKFLDKHSQFH